MPPPSMPRPSRSTTPALGDAARAWRDVADRWEELADAAVPPDLDGAAEAVEAAETLHEAVMAGEPGRRRASDAAATVWAIREHYADAFSLPPDRIAAIFEDLGDQLHAIHKAEVDALEVTAQGYRPIGRPDSCAGRRSASRSATDGASHATSPRSGRRRRVDRAWTVVALRHTQRWTPRAARPCV